ncbi:hypothetical protein C8F04DRAFT_1252785 [Mycena alexandri]|uniref:F-box domain-containing protein n=1 Tax=Mycena alexandri TaxID=1745969 RepID=A0AAD6TDA5_9AGAR|nr:hypothetical protein C8F04DRAFT_1252785 [Mycena alexandri]
MAVGLSTIPLDVQLEILGCIPDFPTLHSSLLINRSFSQLFAAHRPLLIKSVAQSYFGEFLNDALILANTQMTRRFSGAKDHGYKSTFIAQLLSNEEVLHKVQSTVFLFLSKNKKSKENSFITPTLTESHRLKRAAYRFWTFCMGERSNRKRFLLQFPAIELSEIAHMYSGVKAWVTEMYPDSESDHKADHISAVISTGFGRITWLWQLFNEMLDNPEDNYEVFSESLGVSSDCCETDFFRYDFYDCWEHQSVSAQEMQPILDKGHAQIKQKLAEINGQST